METSFFPVSVVPDIGDLDDETLDASVASIAPRASGSRKRWGTRIGFVILLIAGEVVFASRSGALRWPHGIVEAGGAFRAFATGRRATTGAETSVPVRTAPARAPMAQVSANVVTVAVTDLPRAAGASSRAKLAIPPDMGLLTTASAPPGHRIFVDQRAVGQTPQSVLVRCGRASVKLGSAGRERPLDVPCGREVSVGR
jgi:hypothetical protein